MSLDNDATREQNIGALLAADTDPVVKAVPLTAITVIENPRKHYDKDDLEQLASSIERHGLLHAVVLRSGGKPGEYDLIAGTRRHRAYQFLHQKHPTDPRWKAIPASIQDHHKGSGLKVVQAVENIRRADLTVLETADAVEGLKSDGMTPDEIASELGYTRRHVTSYLALAGAPDWLRNFTTSVEISEPVLDDAGNRVEDADGKPKFKTRRASGLGLADIGEAISFWKALDTWDRKQQDANKAHRPKAESETNRAVKKAAASGISGDRLKAALKARLAEITGAATPDGKPEKSQRKPYEVSDKRVVIDVSAIAAPLAPEELARLKPDLTAALQKLGFTTIKLG